MYFCFSVKVNWDNSKFSNDLYCLQLNNNNAKNISNLHHFYSTNKEISIYWWCWRHILHRTIKNPNFRSICHDHHLHVGFLSDSLSGFPSAIFRSFPKWIHNIKKNCKWTTEVMALYSYALLNTPYFQNSWDSLWGISDKSRYRVSPRKVPIRPYFLTWINKVESVWFKISFHTSSMCRSFPDKKWK